MKTSTPLQVHELHHDRPQRVRALITQVSTSNTDWRHEKGLAYPTRPSHCLRWVEFSIAKAREYAVNLIVLPELSVPFEYLSRLQTCAKETGAVVVAGSHYHPTEAGIISRCPVIIGDDLFFVQKVTPAPVETSPIGGEGLTAGNGICLFRRSPIGDFGVLICSDYLDVQLRRSVLDYQLDLLCVPAFQRRSDAYHQRMTTDCEDNDQGIYILYANMLCGDMGDGRSAVFGLMEKLFQGKLVEHGYTDGAYPNKLAEIRGGAEYLVIEVDINKKRPTIPHTVHTRPNVIVVATGPAPKRFDPSAFEALFTFARKELHMEEQMATRYAEEFWRRFGENEIVDFIRLYHFASCRKGLWMNSDEAKEWATNTMCRFDRNGRETLMGLYSFASDKTGLRMARKEALEWTETQTAKFIGKDIGRLGRLYTFASADEGLQMDRKEAIDWAERALGRFANGEVACLVMLYEFASSRKGLCLDKLRAVQWAETRAAHLAGKKYEVFKNAFLLAHAELGFSRERAAEFGEEWIKRCYEKDLTTYKQAYIFACKRSGLHMDRKQAADWAFRAIEKT